ncbi:uncharacterized protein LOC117640186 [Thrips palmi]|uniref:Uncharacterized protein LOC117640186 n=1 Tax=Thrips palmi TaxID=161013 RepID=A0A6P8Y8G2_THRPL|nr:uncharacterized protein LOC117640186 [Thrips palmi]
MEAQLVFTTGLMASMWNVSGLVICEAAHRAADKVNFRFQEVLRNKLQLNYPLMDDQTERELKFFAHAAARADVQMSVGGFFTLRRATFTSVRPKNTFAVMSNFIFFKC